MCVLGRVMLRLSQCLPGHVLVMMGMLLLFELHHACFVCIFPVYYRSPGIMDDAAAITSVATAACIVLIGTTLPDAE